MILLQRAFRYDDHLGGGGLGEIIAFWFVIGIIFGLCLLVSWSNEKLTGAKRKREKRQSEQLPRLKEDHIRWYRMHHPIDTTFDEILFPNKEDLKRKRQRDEAQLHIDAEASWEEHQLFYPD